jgi:hypothetical protein
MEQSHFWIGKKMLISFLQIAVFKQLPSNYQWRTEGFGVFNPPRNSEVLTKLTRNSLK